MIPHARRKARVFTRPKEVGRHCEDVYHLDSKNGRFALSDGASISYNSRGWARTLCKQFLKDTNVGPEWLGRAREKFAQRSAAPMDDWAASHASDRGSFATFLGLTITKKNLVVHAIGDTVLFVVGDEDKVDMWPLKNAGDFHSSPALLCSQPDRSAFADTDEAFGEATKMYDAPHCSWNGTRLIAMTDALAEWTVREGSEQLLARLSKLACLEEYIKFETWVSEAIAAGEVRRDDCTILVLSL